ncbi:MULTISPECIES: hypothetical protein [Chryseobacterium]|uniref:Uncharacterized protein n=1 Tax=Chryseobacterium geocarposphaerae TaxID=1416776 RepID=A0ABU1LCW8_9FLAO|nr:MULTISPECIES: hypothetical protein [Chryseobacterium]MDR6404571.1 hypothetical protein [Chryseobacterium geocarposphaerae]MDR6698197.1 hypothetical protein [Chryseobacterium ginsenosidimutans]
MQKVTPDLYRKLTPAEYKIEFDRIEREIKSIDDIDFEIIINTDIPFYCDFMRTYQRPILENFDNYQRLTFKDFTAQPVNIQKSEYIRYLENIYMFHWSMFLKN